MGLRIAAQAGLVACALLLAPTASGAADERVVEHVDLSAETEQFDRNYRVSVSFEWSI